jgi:hypothetical protein
VGWGRLGGREIGQLMTLSSSATLLEKREKALSHDGLVFEE